MKQIKTYINERLHVTSNSFYTCQPKNKYELHDIIIERIENEGNECDLNDIDVSKITDMSHLFDADLDEIFNDFNGDISMWNVSNVEDMTCMFYSCKKFNCDISQWNVSNVKDMEWMFHGCEKFNGNKLYRWDVSNVTDMEEAFWNCPTIPKWYDRDEWEL